MSKGINMDSFKKKSKGTSSPKKTGGAKVGKKTGGPKVDPMEVVNVGVRAFEEITSLVNTIMVEKEKTAQARERTAQIKLETDRELKILEMNLSKDIKEMEIELEKYREDAKIRIKEINDATLIEIRSIETRELEIKNEHDARMRVLSMQERILDEMLRLYTMYYEKRLNGEDIGFDAEYIFADMGRCLQNLETAIKCLRVKEENRVLVE